LKTGIKVTKNAISLIARETLNKGALFVLLILIGRVLGKEALGRYSLAIAISQVFFFGTELGLNTLLIREVARDKLLAGKFLINIGALRVITGALTMGFIWLTASGLGAKGEAAAVIYLCGLSYFFVNITNVYTSIFRAFEKMELELLVSLLKNIIFLPIAIWMLFNNLGLIAIFNIFLISNTVALVIAAFIFIRKIKAPIRWEADFGFWKAQMAQTSALWFSQMFGVAYLKAAPLLLFRMKGEEAVGLYNAGFVIVDGFWVLTGCFIYSVFPVISRLSASEARKEYLNGFKVIFAAFLILMGIFILTAKNLVPLFYGVKFLEITPLFRLLAIASLLVALDTYNGMTIIAIRKQFLLPFINGAGLLINLVLNVLFISRFSYFGSAYALLASESLIFISLFLCLRKFLLKSKEAEVLA